MPTSPTANAANAAEWPRSSRNAIAMDGHRERAQRRQHERASDSSQNGAERSASPAGADRPPGPSAGATAAGWSTSGAGRSTSACSGTVTAASIDAPADHQRVAPPHRTDEGARERQEDGAREAAEDGQDTAPAFARRREENQSAASGERGLVERRGHREAGEGEKQPVEGDGGVHPGPADQHQDRQRAPGGHQRARAVAVEPASDRNKAARPETTTPSA